MAVGQQINYSTITRDRLVQCCQSSSVADVFQRIVNEEPKANGERIVERLTSAGVEGSDKIIKEVDDYIELHNAGLSSALNVLGLN